MKETTLSARCALIVNNKRCQGIVRERDRNVFVCDHCRRRFNLAEMFFIRRLQDHEDEIAKEKEEKKKEKAREQRSEQERKKRTWGNIQS